MSGGELVRSEQDLLDEAAELVGQTPRMALPLTGEVVELQDPVSVAAGLVRLDAMQRELADFRALLTFLLRAESQRQGSQTLRLGDVEVTLSTSTRPVYDHERLVSELEAAGLPPDRLAVTVWQVVTWKHDARVLRQLEAANPAYAAAIERARTREPQQVRATVKTR